MQDAAPAKARATGNALTSCCRHCRCEESHSRDEKCCLMRNSHVYSLFASSYCTDTRPGLPRIHYLTALTGVNRPIDRGSRGVRHEAGSRTGRSRAPPPCSIPAAGARRSRLQPVRYKRGNRQLTTLPVSPVARWRVRGWPEKPARSKPQRHQQSMSQRRAAAARASPYSRFWSVNCNGIV